MSAPASVSRNIVANLLGKAWTVGLNLAFVPVYIKLLGVEVYGLLGIFLSIVAFISLLDLGLTATLSRELSRLTTFAGAEQEARNLVRTFELFYWAIAVFVGGLVALAAPWLGTHWIQDSTVDPATVQSALLIMGLMAASQWPGAMYAGGLIGLQRQVSLNVARAVISVIQHGGATALLLFVSPSILYFFLWQAATSLLGTAVLAMLVQRALPRAPGAATFDRLLLQRNWRFATGITGITLVTLLLTQVDKVILSRMLTLETFGYYMLAFSVANALHNFVNPVFTALQPRFTQHVTSGDARALADAYHRGCQLIAVLVLPAAATLSLFSREVLSLWIGDPVVVQESHLLLSLLSIGTAMHALVTLPYAMQIAHGKTRLVFTANLIAVCVVMPLMVWMVGLFQGAGAAAVGILLNTGYFALLVPAMHRETLRGEMRSWYLWDVAAPLAAVVLMGGTVRWYLPAQLQGWPALLAIGASFAFTGLAALLTVTQINRELLRKLRRLTFARTPES